MKITVELEQSDYNVLHDVIVEVTDLEPTNEQIDNFWANTPTHIKAIAYAWGTSDTVFRDKFYEYLSTLMDEFITTEMIYDDTNL